MNLDDILKEWETDCQIGHRLDEASQQTPQLHAKYLNYLTQAKLILKRAEGHPEPGYDGLIERREKELLIALARFPETLKDAADELKPGDVTAYANNLADKFNSFYAAHPVLKAGDPGLVGARLKIVDDTRIVLRNALYTLGIAPPERM